MSDDAISQIIDFRFQGLSDANRQLEQTIALVKKLDEALQQLQQRQARVQGQMSNASPAQQPQLQQQIEQLSRAVEDVYQQRATATAQATAHQATVASYGGLRPLQAPPSASGAASGGSTGPTATPPQGPQPTPPHSAGSSGAGSGSGGGAHPPGGGPTPPNAPPPSAPPPPPSPGPAPTPGPSTGAPSLWQRLMGGGIGLGSRAWDNLKEGGGLNVGFSLLYGASDISNAFTPQLTGQRVTPEAQQRGLAGLLSVGGGLIGTAVGGYGGQMVGSGIGEIAQNIFNANSERQEKMRVSSEGLSRALGNSTASAERFSATISDAAQRAGTPMVELAGAVGQLSRSVGVFNFAGAVRNQVGLQQSLGEQYTQIVAAQQGFLQTNPLAFGYRGMVNGTGGVGSNFLDAATYLALTGNANYQDQLIGAGVTQDSARTRYVRSRIGAEKQYEEEHGGIIARTQTGNYWLDLLHNSNPISIVANVATNLYRHSRRDQDLNKSLRDAQAGGPELDTQSAIAKKLGEAKDRYDENTARQNVYATRAATSATEVGSALTLGGTASSVSAEVASQVASLTQQRAEQQTLLSQLLEGQRQARPENRETYNPAIAQLRQQMAQVKAQIVEASTGLFRQNLSESEASYQGRISRLGTRGSYLSMRAVSVDDPRMASVYGREGAAMLAESDRLSRLASGANSLRPEEREQYRSQAAQLRVQATVGLQNERFNKEQSEQVAEQGLRGARVSYRMATAQATGSMPSVVAAQQAELAENLRKQNEAQQDINTLSRQNIGTAEQRKQIEAQLYTLQAQSVAMVQQFKEQVYTAITTETQAAAGAGSALARRLTFGGGTTTYSNVAAAAGITAENGYVAQLKQWADDPTLDPKTRWQRQQKYQEAANQLDADTTAQIGTYKESVGVRRQRQQLEGLSRRMSMTPWGEPGNRLRLDARLTALDQGDLKGIAAQKAYAERQYRTGQITKDQRDNSLAQLEQQEQDIQSGITQRSASYAQSIFGDEISMSIGAPSFASRLMPSPMDAARMAERRGLGPMSARVFGFTSMSAYQDTLTYGMPPADFDTKVFGARPSDYGDDAVQIGGRGGRSGGAALDGDAGSAAALGAQLKELTTAIGALAQHGFRIDVVQINPDTGQRAAHTVNALRNGDTTALQKGGASDTGRARR